MSKRTLFPNLRVNTTRRTKYCLVIFYLLTGCSSLSGGPNLTVNVNKTFEPLRVNEVAVYPLEPAYGQFRSKELTKSLTDDLIDAFDLKTSMDLVQSKEEGGRYGVTAGEGKPPLSERAREFGGALGTQGVLYGIVTRYPALTPDGLDPAAEEGQEVAFKLWLIDPKNGAVLWSAIYNASNMPLSENVLRVPEALKTGVRYKSPRELARNGFMQAAEKLETLRKSP